MTFYLLWFIGCYSMIDRKESTLSILLLGTGLSCFHLLWYISVIWLMLPNIFYHFLFFLFFFVFPQVYIFYSHQFLLCLNSYAASAPWVSLVFLSSPSEKSPSDIGRWSLGIWLCSIECMMSVRETQVKSLCLFVQLQSEIVSQNHQSGLPDMLLNLLY